MYHLIRVLRADDEFSVCTSLLENQSNLARYPVQMREESLLFEEELMVPWKKEQTKQSR